MKVCPECDRTYHDDELNFCLMDGAPLVDGASQRTVAFPSTDAETAVISPRATQLDQPENISKRRIWLPITLAVLGIVIGGVLGGFGLYTLLTRQNVTPQNTDWTSKQPANAPKATPAKSVTTPSPIPDRLEISDDNSDIDAPIDATQILWMTTGVPFEDDKADYSTFMCPKDGQEYPVWGIDIYTSDSSICTAAVHAGVITFASGGKVKVEFTNGRSKYGGSERNGVTSLPYGEVETSFMFLDR